MTAPDPADVAVQRRALIEALDGPEPKGNPLHAAAAEAIIAARLARSHHSGDEQSARAALAIGALEDASAVLAVIAPRIRQQAATQERERWLAAVKASNCVASCDDDCECGPVHCLFIHLPRHKPGWHSAEQCPFADLLRADIIEAAAPVLAAAQAARIAELEQLARDILATYHKRDDGHRGRVGQVQIAKWRKVLDGEK